MNTNEFNINTSNNIMNPNVKTPYPTKIAPIIVKPFKITCCATKSTSCLASFVFASFSLPFRNVKAPPISAIKPAMNGTASLNVS
jgi:hypothetical protein